MALVLPSYAFIVDFDGFEGTLIQARNILSVKTLSAVTTTGRNEKRIAGINFTTKSQIFVDSGFDFIRKNDTVGFTCASFCRELS